MARRSLTGGAPPRTIPEWIVSPWFYVTASAVVGFIVAQTVLGTLPARYVKALIGAIFFLALLRMPIFAAVCLFMLAFPFPTFIYLGNSNVIFVLFMLIFWGVKVRLGKEPVPPRTFLDWAAWAYIGVHVLSFVNVQEAYSVEMGGYQTQFLAAAVGFYFLISKTVRDERHLRIALQTLAVMSLIVSISGVLEYFIPTLILIPDWFLAVGPMGKTLAEGGRVGGIFKHHGLLSDYSAMMFILQIYLFTRSRSLLGRAYYALLMVMGVFLIFVTANRGGFIIWVVGLLYLLWIGRAALTMRRVVIALPLFLSGVVLVEIATARYGKLIRLFIRLAQTQLKRGIPENRVEVWTRVLREIPDHLWLGHGPFYDLRGGGAMGRYWPHSAYLFYLWTTGVIGLGIFLWILIKVIRKTFPGSRLHLGMVPFSQGAMAVTHVMVLQFALAQTRDEHQRGNVYVYLMWTLFGLAAASRRIWDAKKSEAASGSSPPTGT